MARIPQAILFFVVAFFVLVLDQATKALLRSLVAPGGEIVVLPGVFSLVHVWNPGVAFGLLANHPEWARYLLSVVNLLAVFFLYYLVRAGHSPLLCGLVAGGALGNLCDRLLYGRVFDFLDFHLGPYHWPAFNLADAAISLGVLGLLLQGLLSRAQD